MRTTFLYRAYAESNPDLAETFGGDDEVALEDHFTRYGAGERRGVNLDDYMRLEGVFASEEGHLYLAGWADRRMVPSIAVTVIVGYMMYELGEVEPCWYHRPDVSNVTGDTDRPSGFLMLLRIPDITLHSRLTILFNGKKVHESPVTRWQSVDHFLPQALGACAVLGDRPVGQTLEAAERLYPPFAELWTSYLGSLTFTRAFAHGQERVVERSIVITLYRKADMLLPQLETLAPALAGKPVEVVVVANDLATDPALLVARLRAFCQLHDVALSLHLCSGNSGFSAGNNYGADQARGEVLIFMNPDIFPPEGAEAQALAFLERAPDEGVLEGALLYYGDGMLMHSGMYVCADTVVDPRQGRSAPALRVEHFGKGLAHHVDDPGAAPEVPGGMPVLATAALWKIRKALFEEMGGLSTDYLFAYYEDADFCLRLLEAGHGIRIDRDTRWIHMEGVGKAKPPMVRSFMWLNRALFSRRFAGTAHLASEDTDLFQL